MTHYELLDVPQAATPAQIRRAYRDAINAVHTDRGGDPGPVRAIIEARDVLLDPTRRAAYDATLRGPEPPPASTSDPLQRVITGAERARAGFESVLKGLHALHHGAQLLGLAPDDRTRK